MTEKEALKEATEYIKTAYDFVRRGNTEAAAEQAAYLTDLGARLQEILADWYGC